MNIWLPKNMNYSAYKVDKAVREYDERLMFGRNDDTGDWCVFIRMPKGRLPFPVIGFGKDIPEVQTVMARVCQADTLRAGNKIYDEVVKSQEDYRKGFEYKASQASEESAEAVEHFLRKRGKSPVIKSLPKEVSDNAT